MSLLKPTPVSSIEDVQRFFDAFAPRNVEQHGNADKLLDYRVSLLVSHAQLKPSDRILDIGCGNGHHLFAMDGAFRAATGVDLAPGMIKAARYGTPQDSHSTYTFLVDDAHALAQVSEAGFDVVFCVGALEHMPDKPEVLQTVFRVLRKGGRFVCLTPNEQFLWYRWLAPRRGYETRHLSTDRRLRPNEARTLIKKTGFSHCNIDYWTFIPSGDMPHGYATLCKVFDLLGHVIAPASLRGGIVISAIK